MQPAPLRMIRDVALLEPGPARRRGVVGAEDGGGRGFAYRGFFSVVVVDCGVAWSTVQSER